MREYTMRQSNEYSLADAVVRTVFVSIIALFVLYSAVWMVQDIFPDFVLTDQARVWLHAAVVFTAALYETGIRALPRIPGFLCRLCVPAIYAAICFRYMKADQIDLEDGACAMAVQFLEKFNRHLGTFFSIWRGKAELIALAFAFWTLVVLLGLLLLALTFFRYEILLFLPAAVFAAELLIGYIPQWKGLALFFIALLFVHADGGNGNRDGDKTSLRVHMDKKQRYTQAWYLPWLPAFCLSGAAAVILFSSSVLSDVTAQRWMDAAPKVQEFQKKTEQGILYIWNRYFTPRQEKVSNQTPHYTEKEMLKVTASRCPAEDVLLKGFCGTDYQNGSWICDRQKFADACVEAGYEEEEASRELLGRQYDLFSQGAERIMMRYSFGGNFMSMHAAENDNTEYTVEHTGAQSKYAYLPYAVEHGANGEKEHLVSDVSVQKPWRQKIFSYSGWNHFTGGIEINSSLSESREQFFSWYDEFVKKAYLDTSDQIPAVNEYLGEMQKLQEQMHRMAYSVISEQETEPSFYAWDQAEGRNWLNLLQLQQEAEYIEDVFRNNRDRTQAALAISSWRNQNRLQTALVISATLKKYQSYSLNLDPLPQGEDPVNYFLMHSREGYCVHFASAAVLLLRELGIPARYASGYVARTWEFKQNGDIYEASVKDSNAHAWVEIYLEQIGWVPIDVTPGIEAQTVYQTDGGSRDEEDASAGGHQTDDAKTDTDDAQTDTDDAQTDTDDKIQQEEGSGDRMQKGGEKKPVWQRYSLVFAGAAVLLAILAIYVLCRQIIRIYQSMPKREILAGKYSQAVRRISWRIYCRLCIHCRIPRLNLSDAQYEQMLKTVYQQISTDDWARFMQAVKVSAFAQDEVTQKDAQFCWHIYQMIVHKWYGQKVS